MMMYRLLAFIGVVLPCTLSHAGDPSLPEIWAAQSEAYRPMCDAFTNTIQSATPSGEEVLNTAEIDNLVGRLWTYPGALPAVQAFNRATLYDGLNVSDDVQDRLIGACPIALSYMRGVLVVVNSLPQASAPERLKQRFAHLMLHKASQDLSEPAGPLNVMVHAVIMDHLATAQLLSPEGIAQAHDLLKKAEIQRVAVNRAAKGAQDRADSGDAQTFQLPFADELRLMNDVRLTLLSLVHEELSLSESTAKSSLK